MGPGQERVERRAGVSPARPSEARPWSCNSRVLRRGRPGETPALRCWRDFGPGDASKFLPTLEAYRDMERDKKLFASRVLCMLRASPNSPKDAHALLLPYLAFPPHSFRSGSDAFPGRRRPASAGGADPGIVQHRCERERRAAPEQLGRPALPAGAK